MADSKVATSSVAASAPTGAKSAMPKDANAKVPISRNLIYALAAIAVVIVIAVIYVTEVGAQGGTAVANGDTVGVYYVGSFTNGTVFDSNAGKQVLTFTVGANQVIQGFNNAVIGMRVNQTVNVTIPANEAYGEVNPNLVVQVNRTQFGNQTVAVGMTFQTKTNGQTAQGVVKAISGNTVTIDFNPPLAGQTLMFKITVVSIKKG